MDLECAEVIDVGSVPDLVHQERVAEDLFWMREEGGQQPTLQGCQMVAVVAHRDLLPIRVQHNIATLHDLGRACVQGDFSLLASSGTDGLVIIA